MTPTKLIEAAKELKKLKAKKKKLEDQATELNKKITDLETVVLPKLMDDNEIDNVSIKGVGTMFVQTETYVQVNADDRPALYKWLREQGHGPMVGDWVFPNTLKAFVKEQNELAISEGSGHGLPDFVKVTLIPTARIRKAKGK